MYRSKIGSGSLNCRLSLGISWALDRRTPTGRVPTFCAAGEPAQGHHSVRLRVKSAAKPNEFLNRIDRTRPGFEVDARGALAPTAVVDRRNTGVQGPQPRRDAVPLEYWVMRSQLGLCGMVVFADHGRHDGSSPDGPQVRQIGRLLGR